ncbi:MAG: type IV secretion system DNA-binding domain-containing protein [Chloroflexi bacterium]|nr:type IV secretion system DNA-binding domain-containing protein [Chloroflexota bacterium]
MRFNPLKLIQRRRPQGPALLEVTPPRTGERTLLGVENLLQSIAAPEPFALELAGQASGVSLLARCAADDVVRAQIAAHYPQARVRQLEGADDPLRLREGEQAWSITLRPSGPPYAPLRTFRDRDLLDPGSDPLLALVGALGRVGAGERLVARLRLRALGPDWSQPYLAQAFEREQQSRTRYEAPARTQPRGPDPLAVTVLGIGALGVVQGYNWLEAGEIWNLAGLGAGGLGTLFAVGWFKARWNRGRNRVLDPELVREKISQAAFQAEIEVVALLPAGADDGRARQLLEPVASAYGRYDHPAGARFQVGKPRRWSAEQLSMTPSAPGWFGSPAILSVRELAALWHPPGAGDETYEVGRSGAKALPPPQNSLRTGAHVGEAVGERDRPIHFPPDLLRRHQLYVARTRMGKSTLMRHLVEHKLQEKAAGRDTDAVVVIDPHADLVAAILEQVPESLVSEVRLIDLADERGAVGINLLDTRVFADRDRTADAVVRVARGLWDQWGPRMQSILEQTVKTLHEANSHPATTAEQQYTLLDGLRLLTDDEFRAEVLSKLRDPFLAEWWGRDFGGWRREYRGEAIAPVQTRLNYYASSKQARAILGQPRSTVDLRRTILEGGILLVSTAQGSVGRDVAALVGASLLNLVDSTIREQERLPETQRRGALVVVDEMQTIPGVDFESMLSELGKYGAAFVLATQSLAKLDQLSPTMRHTLLANVGCLAVFQVSGDDARQLVWELSRERVSEEDVVSQPAYHCYVRATVGSDRTPVFSMRVRRPEFGDPERAAEIRRAASAYLTPQHRIEEQETELARKLKQLQEGVDAIRQGDQPGQPKSDRSEPPKREDRPARPDEDTDE